MRKLVLATLVGLASTAAVVAWADSHGQGQGQGHDMMEGMHDQMHGEGMQADGHGTMQDGMDVANGPETLAVRDYRQAMDRMMQDMMVPYTGDPDVDFVKGMIPHHQGAIDMAEVVLRYGKDPDIRKLAEGVIGAQTEEIATLRAWLAEHAP